MVIEEAELVCILELCTQSRFGRVAIFQGLKAMAKTCYSFSIKLLWTRLNANLTVTTQDLQDHFFGKVLKSPWSTFVAVTKQHAVLLRKLRDVFKYLPTLAIKSVLI